MPSDKSHLIPAWTQEEVSALSGLTLRSPAKILKGFQPLTGRSPGPAARLGAPLTPAPAVAFPAPTESPEGEARRKWRIFSCESLREHARLVGGHEQIIEGLIPSRSVSILVGRSGLGKSSLMYQAGICVASGLSFLGRRVRKGQVLLVDYENGIDAMLDMAERISAYLGLKATPPEQELGFFSIFNAPETFGAEGRKLMDMLCDLKPQLVIVDSLSSFDPDAETKNSFASKLLSKCRKLLAGQRGTSVLFVHHLRKEPKRAEDSVGPLEAANLSQWFQQVRGASALVNGSDARLAVGEIYGRAAEKSNVALVLRGLMRVRGEVGPLYLARDFDDDQEPRGYRPLVGSELFFDEERERAYRKLPPKFMFAEAKRAYGREDQATADWLRRGVSLGVFRKISRGLYEKL